MAIKITHSRMKEKKASTFGAKKPYAGKDRNRKGSKTKTDGLGCKVEVNRLKPKYSGKKGTKRQRANEGHVPLNADKPVTLPSKQYWQRVKWIQGLGACQVCGEERELDHPHHVEQGSKKDDRYIINICIFCHRLIHEVGYSSVAKSKEKCKEIAWSNNLMCEKNEKEIL